jgi:hypothetical protein
MIQRHVVPSGVPGYEIEVTTEQRPDGAWAAVATVQHETATGVSTTPLDLEGTEFPSESAALATGVRVAREWIDDNAAGDEKKAPRSSK